MLRIFCIVLGIFWTISSVMQAQENRMANDTVMQSHNRRIYLEHANTLSFNKRVSADYQVLRGEVRFRQDSAYMYCDSAYFYENTNSMDAFGNVRMEQGDTLFLFSDSLFYDGNTGLARLRDNVRLIHNNSILYTDNLNYERFQDKAYYFDGGVIVDPDNHLRSELGWYYPNTRLAVFRWDVQLRHYEYHPGEVPEFNADSIELHPDYIEDADDMPFEPLSLKDSLLEKLEPPHASLDPDDEALKPRTLLYSDTLRYSFLTAQADLTGPSRIISDSSYVLTDRGYYNTRSGQAFLYDRSRIYSPMRFATGDTLFYDQLQGYGEAFGHAEACDTLNSVKLSGDYVYYNNQDESILVTGNALAMEFSDRDTLYLHADTLRAFTKDSVHYMNAYYAVRYYRNDLQGVCDSLIYSTKDSVSTFMGNPVMWNGFYQITGDTIFIKMGQNGVDRAMVHDYAFLVQQKDSVHYDQISGKELVCYFDSSKVERMDMEGNVQIIYYPEESDKSLIGLNQMIGNYLSVWFKSQKMDRLRIWPEVVGSLTPLPLVTDEILYLQNFRWMQYLRPIDPQDVFRDVRMKSDDRQEHIQLFNEDELNGY